MKRPVECKMVSERTALSGCLAAERKTGAESGFTGIHLKTSSERLITKQPGGSRYEQTKWQTIDIHSYHTKLL